MVSMLVAVIAQRLRFAAHRNPYKQRKQLSFV